VALAAFASFSCYSKPPALAGGVFTETYLIPESIKGWPKPPKVAQAEFTVQIVENCRFFEDDKENFTKTYKMLCSFRKIIYKLRRFMKYRKNSRSR
jgi:hypothetical protein